MKQRITLFVCLGIFALLTSCNRLSPSSRSLLINLTPNMHGLAETHNEHSAGKAVVDNTNTRSFEDDWTRFMMLDHPSTLSPHPVVRN